MSMKPFLVSICIIVIFSLIPNVSSTPFNRNNESSTEPVREELPSSFSLLDVDGTSFVSSVKSQRGGTCWAHATMSSMESDLLMTGLWNRIEGEGEPDLAEYHLDWWNGFNNNYNEDVETPEDEGIWVHYGGDYLMSTAYLSRGEGAVRDIDGQKYEDPPEREFNSYHEYTPLHVEWYTVDDSPDGMDGIKKCIMKYGAMGTSMLSDGQFRDVENLTHYQPPSSDLDLNHAVAIVGWDDDKVTQAPQPGAWLIKNSWGSQFNFGTYFWISYYDKYTGRHPELGAVSFRNVSFLAFDKVYFHDFHGWRDTWTNSTQAFNSYSADRSEQLKGASFFTTEDNVHFTITVFDDLENGILKKPRTIVKGFQEKRGLHTVFFDKPLDIREGDDFHIHLNVSGGGIAMDRTSKIPLLMKSTREPSFDAWVNSTSHPNESFYMENGTWKDLYYYNDTANFCIKGLVGHVNIETPMTGDTIGPGSKLGGPISIQMDSVEIRIDEGSPMNARVSEGKWELEGSSLELEEGEHRIEVTGYQDGITEITESAEATFFWEITPPECSIDLKGILGNDSWYTSSVDINISGSDSGSGLKEITYSLDHGPEMIFNGSFTVDAEGEHSISFKAVDNVGNKAPLNIKEFKIDLSSPRTDLQLEGTMGENDWFIDPVDLLITADQDTSGADHIIYRVNGADWKRIEMEGSPLPSVTLRTDQSGEYNVELYCVDKAGIKGELMEIDYKVDLIDPAIEFEIEGVEGSNGWYRSDVQVKLDVIEDHSGIMDIHYRSLGGHWNEYSDPLFIGVQGEHTIQSKVADKAGRSSGIIQEIIRVDTTPPVTSKKVQGEMGDNGWYISNVSIDLTSKDKVSGPDIIRYSIDNSSYRKYSGTINIDDPGHHRVSFYSRDNAGNSESPNILELRLDLNDPLVWIKDLTGPLVTDRSNISIEIGYWDLEDPHPELNCSIGWHPYHLDIEDTNIDIPIIQHGINILHLTITDSSGRNMTFEQIILYVEIQDETGDQDDYNGSVSDNDDISRYILSVILISSMAIALLSAIFIIFLKRKKKDP